MFQVKQPEERHLLFECPSELAESVEFRPELDRLIEEFALRLGTLAERCLQPHRLH
jgi:hypothetical protein